VRVGRRVGFADHKIDLGIEPRAQGGKRARRFAEHLEAAAELFPKAPVIEAQVVIMEAESRRDLDRRPIRRGPPEKRTQDVARVRVVLAEPAADPEAALVQRRWPDLCGHADDGRSLRREQRVDLQQGVPRFAGRKVFEHLQAEDDVDRPALDSAKVGMERDLRQRTHVAACLFHQVGDRLVADDPGARVPPGEELAELAVARTEVADDRRRRQVARQPHGRFEAAPLEPALYRVAVFERDLRIRHRR